MSQSDSDIWQDTIERSCYLQLVGEEVTNVGSMRERELALFEANLEKGRGQWGMGKIFF